MAYLAVKFRKTIFLPILEHASYLNRVNRGATVRLSWAIFASLWLSGCSIFFGNIKPVEEKAKNYGILDLSKENSDWVKLDQKSPVSGAETKETKETAEAGESGVSDVAFQSKRTASIISINSACKSYSAGNDYESDGAEKDPLKTLTNELFLGISGISMRNEVRLTVEKNPALETTIRGKINHEDMVLKTVVTQRANCVYDLMYVARPDKFDSQVEDFSRFVRSLKLK